LKKQDRFIDRYKDGNTPWDLKRPDFNLIEVVEKEFLNIGNALVVGCGTGDNSIFLSKSGFNTTGIDLSPLAIEKAKAKSEDLNNCNFKVMDFLKGNIEKNFYDFVFDRGCFHTFYEKHERDAFAKKVYDSLKPDSFWLSLLGNSDEKSDGSGPPRLNVRDISGIVEPLFEIISIKSSFMDSNSPDRNRSWQVILKKRKTG
jgi:methyl halide transferase